MLILAVGVLMLAGCRNRHLAKDQQHQAVDLAFKQYEQDCPASATAGNPAKMRECQAEHDHAIREFQKMQAVEHGDCDRPSASRPAVSDSR
ncbi:hypothetical protein [Terriglobus aquaticus]|uniref:hypothetical protein n=1 Tax=Terriglobus aquaticus TaxID=940139 RepID=UPI0031DF23A2